VSDIGLLTMLAVRLRSRGTTEAITETVAELDGGEPADLADRVDRLLLAAVDDGRLRRRGDEGRHSLTPTGDAELSALLAAELTGLDRADVMVAYEAFLPLNRRFLTACVDWQDGLIELEAFLELVGELVPVLDTLAAIRLRFAGYAPRLVRALSEATVDPTWIDAPSLDSVHTVWFELHEHLLASLGRARTDERS
ncbi:MAG: hypothetical protein AAGE98_17170, partial [Actinomycetota bacterium]